MTNKTKKIIAREGLVVLGLVLCSILIVWTGRTLPFIKWVQYQVKPEPHWLLASWSDGSFVFLLLFAGYPSYLLIRFIIWAVRTLRKNV